MEFRTERLILEIDEQTGSISHLHDVCTGLVHINDDGAFPTDARLFRFLVPIEGWHTRYVDNREQAAPLVKADGDAILLKWPQVIAADGCTLAIAVQVRIEAIADEVRFTLAVDNQSAGDVIDVCFPTIGDWRGIGGKGLDSFTAAGNMTPLDPHTMPFNKGTTYAKVHQRATYSYPLDMYLPWIDLSGPGGGISYIVYMADGQNGFIVLENQAGYDPGLRFSYGWLFPTVVAPGEAWVTSPVGISLHAGDWHDTADRYRKWMESWFIPPPGKRELRDAIGFQNIMLRSFDGKPVHPLESIPEIAAIGREYGVDQLCIWDVLTLGTYARHMDRDLLEYSAEEKAVISAGLARAKAEGTNVNALINFRLLNPSSSLFAHEGKSEVLQNYDGTPRLESYAVTTEAPISWSHHLGPSVYPASPHAASYRERVLRQTREYLELGYCSMFYDQPFELCPDYGHRKEGLRSEATYTSVLSLLKEVREILHQHDANSFVIGEFCEAFMSQYIDLWMAWYVDVNQLIRSRYALPQTMQSWVVDTDIAQASHAFALGAYLCLCTHGNECTLADVPVFAEHVAQLAKLRKLTAERTVHARFCDQNGLQISGNDGFVAYSYDSAGGPAVIVAATKGACVGNVTVHESTFIAPGSGIGNLYYLDGRVSICNGNTQSFRLGDNEVVVWVL